MKRLLAIVVAAAAGTAVAVVQQKKAQEERDLWAEVTKPVAGAGDLGERERPGR